MATLENGNNGQLNQVVNANKKKAPGFLKRSCLFICNNIFKDFFLSEIKIGILLAILLFAVLSTWYLGGLYLYSVFVYDDIVKENADDGNQNDKNASPSLQSGKTNSYTININKDEKIKTTQAAPWLKVRKSEIEKNGQTGDMFGGINALFTGIASVFSLGSILFILHQIMLQKNENKTQNVREKQREANDGKTLLITLSVEFLKRFSPQDILDFNNVIIMSSKNETKKRYYLPEESIRIVDNLSDQLNQKINNALADNFEMTTPPELIHLLEIVQGLTNEKARSKAKVLYNNFILIVNFFTIYISIYMEKSPKPEVGDGLENLVSMPDLISGYTHPLGYLFIQSKNAANIEIKKGSKLELFLSYFNKHN